MNQTLLRAPAARSRPLQLTFTNEDSDDLFPDQLRQTLARATDDDSATQCLTPLWSGLRQAQRHPIDGRLWFELMVGPLADGNRAVISPGVYILDNPVWLYHSGTISAHHYSSDAAALRNLCFYVTR